MEEGSDDGGVRVGRRRANYIIILVIRVTNVISWEHGTLSLAIAITITISLFTTITIITVIT